MQRVVSSLLLRSSMMLRGNNFARVGPRAWRPRGARPGLEEGRVPRRPDHVGTVPGLAPRLGSRAMTMDRRDRLGRRRGATAAVELGLTLPLILWMLIG